MIHALHRLLKPHRGMDENIRPGKVGVDYNTNSSNSNGNPFGGEEVVDGQRMQLISPPPEEMLRRGPNWSVVSCPFHLILLV